jgi:HSP20 family protein
MADTKALKHPPEQRGIARRQDYPERDLFAFSPLSIMRRLSEEMDHAFARSLGAGRGFHDTGMWSPAVDIRQKDGYLEISAELPGLGKDDVRVECAGEGIVIQGEKKQEHETDEGGWHRTERSYGQFYRMIPLPEGANAEQAKAEFKDGVLCVRVPLSEQKQQSRQIPITT